MNRKEALERMAAIETETAALRAIIEAPEKPTRRDWREEDLRAGLRFKNDQREFRELQEPNLDKKAFAPGWRYGEGTGNWDQSTYIVKCLNNRDLNPNLDPDIHGANPSEDARLWLESFVPVYGLTVTREAAEAWLERFGKVRGFSK